jgi:hypothetical protein
MITTTTCWIFPPPSSAAEPVAEAEGVAVAPLAGVAVATADDDGVAVGAADPGDEATAVGVPAGNCGSVVVLFPQPLASASVAKDAANHAQRTSIGIFMETPMLPKAGYDCVNFSREVLATRGTE